MLDRECWECNHRGEGKEDDQSGDYGLNKRRYERVRTVRRRHEEPGEVETTHPAVATPETGRRPKVKEEVWVILALKMILDGSTNFMLNGKSINFKFQPDRVRYIKSILLLNLMLPANVIMMFVQDSQCSYFEIQLIHIKKNSFSRFIYIYQKNYTMNYID